MLTEGQVREHWFVPTALPMNAVSDYSYVGCKCGYSTNVNLCEL